MADLFKRTLALTGGREGKTVLLAKRFKFVDGLITLQGPLTSLDKLTHWLQVHYQVRVVSSEPLEAANGNSPAAPAPDEGEASEVERDLSQGRPGPETPPAVDGGGDDDPLPDSSASVPAGDRHGHAGVSEIREALTALDVADDEHWTEAGQPLVQAVIDVLGRTVTRADIDAAAPGFTREGE